MGGKRGNIIVAALAVVLLITITLALLTHTITHIRIVKNRRIRSQAVGQTGQELLKLLHQYRTRIWQTDLNNFADAKEDFFNSDHFPIETDTRFEVQLEFSFQTSELSRYKRTRISACIEVLNRLYSLEVRGGMLLYLLEGELPLPLFPLLLNRSITNSPADYLSTSRINISGGKKPLFEDVGSSIDPAALLADALQIEGGVPNWQLLREKIGLDASENPPGNGVYLVVEGDTVQTLLVQGDIDDLILSTEDNVQTLELVQQGTVYRVNYVPGQAIFSCWDGSINPASFFQEKVFVNGNVWSMRQAGGNAFTPESGITLTVVGRLQFSSSLVGANPGLNKRQTNLTLICPGRELFSDRAVQADIVVLTGEEIEIEASIITAGKFINRNNRLSLSGSLFSHDLTNDGEMVIHYKKSGIDDIPGLRTRPLFFISDCFISYIEEAENE